MSDEARHVAFGVLSLQEYYQGLNNAEIHERQEFAFESAVQLQQRFMGRKTLERAAPTPMRMSACLDDDNDPANDVFQTMLFSKIVPNCKKLGLLDAGDGWLRQRFTELGIIQFEDWTDTTDEYESLDASGRRRRLNRHQVTDIDRHRVQNVSDTMETPTARTRSSTSCATWLGDELGSRPTVGEWWERLGLAGWAAPALPTNAYGRGSGAQRRGPGADEIAEFGALGAPGGPGAAAGRADDRHPRHPGADRPATCATSSPAPRPGASSSASRAPAPTWPGSPAGPSRTATSGSSTVRRSGRRSATSPTWACSSPAPTPTCPSTRASPTSRSTCTSPASRSGRCVEMTGHAMFNEVFLTDGRVSRRRDHRRAQQRLGGRQHHARCTSGPASGRGGGSAAAGTATPGHGRRPARPSGPATSSPQSAAKRSGGAVAAGAGGGRRQRQDADRPGQGQRQASTTRRSART